MACDLTWILARSFREVELRASAQPDEKGIRAAAYEYTTRGYSQHVHHAIKALIPRKDLKASFKVQQVQLTVETLFDNLKDELKAETGLTPNAHRWQPDRRSWDDTSTDADSTLFTDAQEANTALAELEAGGRPPIPELDGTGAIFELPTGEKEVRLNTSVLESGRMELEGLTRRWGT